MTCPACGHYDSYTGLQWIHCRNGECRYYDRKYDEQRFREELGASLDELDESPAARLRRIRETLNGP
jgi:hypothetical protein